MTFDVGAANERASGFGASSHTSALNQKDVAKLLLNLSQMLHFTGAGKEV
jgi:hypothetical protein